MKAISIFILLILLTLSTFAQTSIKGTVFNVRDFGAKGDGVTSDQTAVAAAITATVAAGGGVVKVPKGTYLVTGLTIPGGVRLQGDGRDVSIIYSTTNSVIVDAVEGASPFQFEGPDIADLTIRGAVGAGTSQKCLQMTDGSFYYGSTVQRVNIENCGDNGLSIGNVFNSSWSDLLISNTADYPLLYDAAGMPGNSFRNIFVGDIRASAPTAFRIKRGIFDCVGCNSVANVVAASRSAAVGTKNGVDGDVVNAGGEFICRNCNHETWVGYGIYVYANSYIELHANQFSMDASGATTGIPVYFENNGNGSDYFSQYIKRGLVDDGTVFGNTITDYAQSQPIHSIGFPAIETDGYGPSTSSSGILGTYYETGAAASRPLSRKDANSQVVTVTSTTSFSTPGVTYIEANCAAACQITLPWAAYYRNGQRITIKDISGAASTNNVTVAANSTSTVNSAASYVINQNGQSVTFIPNPTVNGGNGDWRVITNTPATSAVTGSGANGRVTFWTGAQTQSSDSTFFWNDTDNRLGIGTGTPGLPLDVVSDSGALAQQWRETGAGTTRVQMQVPSGFGLLGTSTNDDFGLMANNTQFINLEATGGTVFGSIVPAQATIHVNALVNTDVALQANNASGATTDIAKFQVGGSNRFLFNSTGTATFGLASTATGKVILANASNANLLTLQPGATGSALTFTLPIADGTSGQCMQTNGSGVLSFASCGGSPTLTATYIGYGNGSNVLTGSANHTWDETNKIETLTSASTGFIRLATGSTAAGVAIGYNLGGTGAIHPGSGGGILFPLVGGSQSSGPGIWWTNNAYNATAGLWISNGLNWQGHSTSGSPFKVRTGTGTSSDGTVRFTLAPDSSLFTQNASTAQTAANVDVEVVDMVTTGTAAANLGIGRLYTLENASGSQVNASRIGTRWAVATGGSETSTFFVANNNAGAGLADSFTIQADQYHGTYIAANITGAATIDFNNGNVQELTFTGNVTSTTLSNLKEGAIYFIIFKQSAGGGNTLASTNIKVEGGSLALTATANARDLFQCAAIGSNLYCSKALDVK